MRQQRWRCRGVFRELDEFASMYAQSSTINERCAYALGVCCLNILSKCHRECSHNYICEEMRISDNSLEFVWVGDLCGGMPRTRCALYSVHHAFAGNTYLNVESLNSVRCTDKWYEIVSGRTVGLFANRTTHMGHELCVCVCAERDERIRYACTWNMCACAWCSCVYSWYA